MKKRIFLFWWLSFVIFGTFYNQPGLEYEKFRQAKAIAFDFRLSINNQLPFDSHAAKIGDKIYIHQALGAGAYMAPFAFIFRILGSERWNFFVTKVVAVYGLQALALMLLTMGLSHYFSALSGFLVLLIFVFGSDWFSNWKFLSTDGISLSWMIVGLFASFSPQALPKLLQKPKVILALQFLGGVFTFWARYQMLVTVVPLLFMFAWLGHSRKLLIFSAGLVFGVGIQAIVNWVTIGSPTHFAIQYSCFGSCLDPQPPNFIDPAMEWQIPLRMEKIWEDLFGINIGIFRYSPLLLLTPFAVWFLRRQKEVLALFITGLIACAFLFVSNSLGAGGWGNRFALSLHLWWGIPVMLWLLQLAKKNGSYVLAIAALAMVTPVAFAGSFFYQGDIYDGKFYQPGDIVSLAADLVRWHAHGIAEPIRLVLWTVTFLGWIWLLVSTVRKIRSSHT